MRSSIVASIFLHAAVMLLGVYGLPAIRKPPVMQDIPMVVEIIPIALNTNLPFAPEPAKEPPKKAEVKPPKPPPAPKVKKAPPPPPPAPKPEVAVVPPPEPKPVEKPKAKPKVEAKPKPKAKAKPKTPKNLAKAKPRRKPKPPDRFAMVLKNLAIASKKPAPKTKLTAKKKTTKEVDFMARMSKSVARKPTEFDPNKKISLSELDAMQNIVRKVMEKCWNFDPGAKGAQDLVIKIDVALDSNGKVLRSKITNTEDQTDTFKQSASESALRAVSICQPYKLPTDKYQVWKDLKLTFNPREMLGR